jgi:hypothetical protein
MWYLRQYNGAFATTGQIRRIVVDSSWVAPPPPPEPLGVDFRPPYPAPASTSVVFDFTLTQVARTRLTVYDMRGALVRKLWFDEATPIGLNRVVWDGLDDDGRLARSGVYFAVLDVDGRTHARRIPIVR